MRIPNVIILLLLCSLVMSPLLKPGLPIFLDNPSHIQEIAFLDTVITEQGGVSGYIDGQFAGMPFQLYRYQSGLWISWALSKNIGLELGYKLSILLAYVFSTLMFYLLASAFLRKDAALTASILYLLSTQVISRILEGMWSEYLGLGILFLSLWYLERHSAARSLRNMTVLSTLLGLTIITHLYSAIVLMGALLIYTLVRSEGRAGSLAYLHLATTYLLGLGLAGFYLYHHLATKDWYGVFISQHTLLKAAVSNMGYLLFKSPELFTISEKPLLFALLSIPSLFAALLALWGVPLAWKQRLFRQRWSLLLLLCAGLAWGLAFFIPGLSFLEHLNPSRFIIYERAIILLLAGWGLSRLKINHLRLVQSLCVLYAITFIAFAPGAWTATSQSEQGMAHVQNVWDWIVDNPPRDTSGRVLYQGPEGLLPGALGKSHIFSLSPLFTGRDALGNWFGSNPVLPIEEHIMSTKTSILGMDGAPLDEALLVGRLQRYHINQLVVLDTDLTDRLSGFDNFTKEKQAGPFAIFTYQGELEGLLSFSAPVQYELLDISDSKITLRVDDARENTTLLVKKQHHPYWKAHIDGERAQVYQTSDALMQVPLREGTLTLEFETPRTGLIISSASALILFALMFFNRRNDT